MPPPTNASKLEDIRKDLEPSVRASFIVTAIQNLAEHAAKGGKVESLDRDNLLRLFEVVGSLAKEANATLEPELSGKVHKFKEAKTELRKQVLNGISPPSLTIPLIDAEIFTEDLFPKDIYLKVDAEAIKSDEKNHFPAFQKKAPGKRQADWTPEAPLRKRTKPMQVANPTTARSTPPIPSTSKPDAGYRNYQNNAWKKPLKTYIAPANLHNYKSKGQGYSKPHQSGGSNTHPGNTRSNKPPHQRRHDKRDAPKDKRTPKKRGRSKHNK